MKNGIKKGKIGLPHSRRRRNTFQSTIKGKYDKITGFVQK